MTITSEKALRQLGDAGSRLAVSVARDEHVLRRVEGSSREGEWRCSCGVGFPVPGDARDRAQIEHSAHLWSTVREACEAQGFTLSTAWMAGVKKAEADLVAARDADEPIVTTDPVDYSLVALRRLLKAAQSKLDRIIADSPNDHRAREVTSAQVRSLKLAVSVVEGSRKAVATVGVDPGAPIEADVGGIHVTVHGGGMLRSSMEAMLPKLRERVRKATMDIIDGKKPIPSDLEAMTDRQLSNVLHGRDKDNNGEFTASSMGEAQEMVEIDTRRNANDVAAWITRQQTEARTNGQPDSGDWRSLVQNIDLIVIALRAYATPPTIDLGTVIAENKGNALTDCGPDFRVVPVRVLQAARDLLVKCVNGTEYDTGARGPIIELTHLINERRGS